MNKDLKQLREIQETGSLIYQDKSFDNTLLRRGIEVIERINEGNTSLWSGVERAVVIQFKNKLYKSHQEYNSYDNEVWTEWQEVTLVTIKSYEYEFN